MWSKSSRAAALEQPGVLGRRGEQCWTLHGTVSWHEIFGILRWEATLGCHLKQLVLSVRLGTGRCSVPGKGSQRPGASILPWGARSARGTGDTQAPSAPPAPDLVSWWHPLPCWNAKIWPRAQERHKWIRSEFGKEYGNHKSLGLLVGDTGNSVLSSCRVPKFIHPFMCQCIIHSPISPFPASGLIAGHGSKQQILSHPKGTQTIPVEALPSCHIWFGFGGWKAMFSHCCRHANPSTG